MRFEGIAAAPGTALGKALVFLHADQAVPAAALDPEKERVLFRRARKTVYDELLTLASVVAEKFGADEAGIFEGYAAILMDNEIEETALALIQEGRSAVQAALSVMDGLTEEWKAMEGAYMAERASDLRDLGKKLAEAISGRSTGLPVLTEPVILIADTLSPFETARLDHRFLKALALESGGRTGHVAILANSLGIPCVVGLAGAAQAAAGDTPCVLDGDAGLLILSPDAGETAHYRENKNRRELRISDAPGVVCTADGVPIAVMANIGSEAEALLAVERNADGVGLLRTEFLYMNTLPGEEEQLRSYKKIIEALGPRPLTIRTMDIGGDKEFPTLGIEKEDNPFLGYRAIRIGLDQQTVLKTQIRAVLRASAPDHPPSRTVEMMFPMVISLDELNKAKALVEICCAELEQEGLAFGKPLIGVMVETPAAALMAEELASTADFFSLGTNDLTQYTLAVDRGNAKIASLYDPLHPAVLRLMAKTCEAALAANIPAGICGELAGDTAALPLLIGMGLGKLSLASPKIASIKGAIQKLNSGACKKLAQKALACKTAGEVHALLPLYNQEIT
jgi:phosphotransferase system enzyme I (PtsI)